MTRRHRMPTAAVLGIAILIAASPAFAVIEGSMVTYVNARYGYSIQYPYGVFVAEAESENGDGRVFHSHVAGAEFRVWANYAAQEMTPAQLADEIQADCTGRHAGYRVVRKTMVAVSCDMGHDVLYEKELINHGLVTAFRITYPAVDGAYWSPIVTVMSGSLRAGRG